MAKQAVKRFAADQRDLWTSPIRVRPHDAKWLLLLGGTAAGLMAADHSIMQHNTLSAANMRTSVNFSNVGLGAMVGLGGALFLWGSRKGDDQKEEAGLLSGESAISALVATTIMGYALGRERPYADDARGDSFRAENRFPPTIPPSPGRWPAWWRTGYPGKLTKLFAYGLASAVSVSRVTGNQHFPSDVLVGGAMGWLISRDIYDKHHDGSLGGAPWGGAPAGGGKAFQRAINLASPYVPLDSWVYSDLERLEALGYVHSGFLGHATLDAEGVRATGGGSGWQFARTGDREWAGEPNL